MPDPQFQGKILSFLHYQSPFTGNYLSNESLIFWWRDPRVTQFTSIKLKGSFIRVRKEPGRPSISNSCWFLVEGGHLSTISALESLIPTTDLYICGSEKKQEKSFFESRIHWQRLLFFIANNSLQGLLRIHELVCHPSKRKTSKHMA